MKAKTLLFLPILAALSGCTIAGNKIGGKSGNGPIIDADPFTPSGDTIDDGTTSGDEIEVTVDEDDGKDIGEQTVTSDITDLSVAGITYSDTDKLFTITAAGEFVFTGTFEGNILVVAGEEDDVKITLNNFTIKSTTDAPIKCTSAAELQISVKNGTKNYVYDYRSAKTEDNDAQGNGAITSDVDLKLSGKGSLEIVAKYNNGLHTKDNLGVEVDSSKGGVIQIHSYNNCLKGNDQVKIESGKLVLISTGGNGILTENTDLSKKGKQKGSILITGGQIDIYSAKDAIDAAYNVDISKGDGDAPIINIYTNKFSSYTADIVESSTTSMYLKVANSSITSGYFYAVEFLKNDYTTTWVKSKQVTSNSSYYSYFEVERPNSASSFKVGYFYGTVTELSEANASLLSSDYSSINSYYDTVTVTRTNSGITIGNWSNYGSTNRGPGGGGQPGGGGGGQPGGMSEGNNDKADVSAKGIKASNEIIISDGQYFIKAYDDAIHANYGDTFESGSTGVGDVTISGGTFDIYASDDALHADHELEISGGTIDVKNSYEGLEGNLITITGGYTKVYATDDGLNAANKSGVSPAIKVSGGIVDVTVYGQDVDGIDSNGTFTQSGGIVVTKGGNGGMSTGLDTDGTASVTGGTFICFGKPEKTPSRSGVTDISISGSWSAGNRTITFSDNSTLAVTTKFSYSQIYAYSNVYSSISVK